MSALSVDAGEQEEMRPFYFDGNSPPEYAFVCMRGKDALVIADEEDTIRHVFDPLDGDILDELRRACRNAHPPRGDNECALAYVRIGKETEAHQVLDKVTREIPDPSLRYFVRTMAGVYASGEHGKPNKKFMTSLNEEYNDSIQYHW